MSSFMDKLPESVGAFSSELKYKILFVLFALIIYRMGTYIPLPGINSAVLSNFMNTQAGGVLGIFNMFTGGALGRMSIFALNIMPYITASIIMQLMTTMSPDLSNLKKEGESGRKRINQYTRYLTVILALTQGYGIAAGIENLSSSGEAVVSNPGYFFRITAMISLMGGTIFVMWLGEQISIKGIGNGTSLIIFTGIIAGLPSAFVTFFEMGRAGSISTFMIIVIIAMVVALIYFIVFMEKSQRRVLVQYPKRQIGRKIYQGDSTYLPLKLNTAGVIPPIFASSILLFPSTVAGFLPNAELGSWQQVLLTYLGHGKPLYIILYILMIVFFTFFYTSIIFNPDETADNLYRNGGVILGRRPGKHTAKFFDYILTRITVIGALYIAFICVLPEIMISKYSVPFYLGGTSLLIVVNVVTDTFSQIQAHLLSSQYSGLMKKANKLKRKK